MKDLVQISVIIPVYNVKQYLPQCIEFVTKESKYNIEILLVDDGSTDGSGDMCDKYAALYKNIKVIHKANGGLGSARNAGMSAAEGEYILYLDSDDYIYVESIEDLYEKASENHLDMVLFGAASFYEDEMSAKKMPKSNYSRKCCIGEICSGLELITAEQKCKAYITSVCLRLYRREYLLKGGYRFNETVIHEDVDYSFFTLLNAEKVMACDKNYYYRRYRQGSIIMDSQLHKKFVGYEYAWNEFVKYIDSDDTDKRKQAETIKRTEVYVRAILAIVSDMSRAEKRKIKAELKRIIKTAKTYRRYYRKSTMLSLYFPMLSGMYMRSGEKILWLKKFLKFVCSEPLFVFKLMKIGIPSSKERIYLMGTPIHGNAGDHLIAIAEKQFVQKRYPQCDLIDCSMSFANLFGGFIQKHVASKDLVIISGGGWLGTDWSHNEIFVREKVREFENNCVVILPQTVFYAFKNSFLEEGKETYGRHEHLIFCLREKQSYDFVISECMAEPSKTLLLPDFALLYKETKKQECKIAQEAKLCFRNDLEKVLENRELRTIKAVVTKRDGGFKEFDTVEKRVVPLRRRDRYVQKKLKEVREAKYVVTDRLHAMIMCALAGTPCVAYDNSTHKVRNVYEWLDELSYIHVMNEGDSLSDVIEGVLQNQRLDNLKEFQELNLDAYFDCLPEIIEKQKGKCMNAE